MGEPKKPKADPNAPDPTKYRCRVCKVQGNLRWDIKRQDLPVITSPTGKPEYEFVCSDPCRRLEMGHQKRKVLKPERRLELELREMCVVRDELRRKGVDRATACRMAAEISVAAADPPELRAWLHEHRSERAAA